MEATRIETLSDAGTHLESRDHLQELGFSSSEGDIEVEVRHFCE